MRSHYYTSAIICLAILISQPPKTNDSIYPILKFCQHTLEKDSILNTVLAKQDADLIIRKIEQCNDNAIRSIALFNLGKILYYQDSKKEGYSLMRQANEMMKATNYKYKFDRLSYNNKTLQSLHDFEKHTNENLKMSYNRARTQELKSAIIEFSILYEIYDLGREQQKQNRLFYTKIIGIFIVIGLACKLPNTQPEKIAISNKILITLPFKNNHQVIKKKKQTHIISAGFNKQENTATKITDTDIDGNARLFEKLEEIVAREKLYLDPTLSREKLMKRIHVNKNRFGKILKQHAGTNAATYINNKRLEYACKLLYESPQYTITAIGELCGIPNPSTFNRLFRCKFGMSPSEFKNIRPKSPSISTEPEQ